MFEEPKQDKESPETLSENTPARDTTELTPVAEQTTPHDESIEQQSESPMPFETEDTQLQTPAVSTESPQKEVAMPAPITPAPTKPKKKALLIGIIIAVVLLVLGGSSAFAYMLYQTPQKVITDAIINAYTAKTATLAGTVSIDSSGTTAKIDMNAKSDDVSGELDAKVTLSSSGKSYAFDASVLQDKSNNLYLKVANIDSIVTAVKAALPTIPAATIDSLVAKINDVWIKVSADDLKTYSESASKTQSCLNTASDTLKNDKAAQKEISDVYMKNQFIVINKELGTKDGSMGYDITTDPALTKSFVDGLKTTKVYTALHNCDNTITIDSSNIDTKKPGTLEIWVSTWSHQLTKVVVNSTSNGSTLTANIVPTFNQPVTVTAPTHSTTLTQLTTDLTSILESVSGTNSTAM